MARCGFCNHTNLAKTPWNPNGNGQGLESHVRPGTQRQPCYGLQTYLMGAPIRTKKPE